MSDQNATPNPLEMFRRLWGPLGLPLPGMTMPTLDPGEIDKRIAELRSVEAWLSMNLNMVRLAMQGLEVQKAALQAMHAVAGAGKAAAGSQAASAAACGDLASGAATSGMLWPWAMFQQAMQGQATPKDKGAPDSAPPGKGKRK